MAKTANINVRVDPETKSLAEELFSSFGITITDAINMFLRKSIMEGGLPFEVKQPRYNQETEAAMEEARLGRNLVGPFHSVDALIESLNADD